jgi:hypothetical protein
MAGIRVRAAHRWRRRVGRPYKGRRKTTGTSHQTPTEAELDRGPILALAPARPQIAVRPLPKRRQHCLLGNARRLHPILHPAVEPARSQFGTQQPGMIARQAMGIVRFNLLTGPLCFGLDTLRMTDASPMAYPVCAAPKKVATASQLDRISSMIASAGTLRC